MILNKFHNLRVSIEQYFVKHVIVSRLDYIINQHIKKLYNEKDFTYYD